MNNQNIIKQFVKINNYKFNKKIKHFLKMLIQHLV